jgi:hypothetical protein
MLITIYDHTTPPFIEGFIDYFNRRNCVVYASEVFKDLDFSKEIAINYAIKRAKYACATLNIPVAEHFVSVYRAIDDEVYVDWKLSSFAAYLSLLNGNPSDPLVASFQQNLVNENSIKKINII